MRHFVLVHGAFEGGWIWQRVVSRLRAAGHSVTTPTLTGCGERFHLLSRDVGLATHVQDVTSHLDHLGLRDVVLVGHSYGGTVVTQVADRCADRVGELVYLDASAPVSGQTATGAFAEGTTEVLADMSGDDWLLPPLPLDAVGVTDPEDVAWLEPLRHPHPMRTLSEPVQLEHGDEPPFLRRYIVHERKERMVELFGVDPLAPFVARAEELGWPVARIDAGHDAMVTHPAQVAEVLAAGA